MCVETLRLRYSVLRILYNFNIFGVAKKIKVKICWKIAKICKIYYASKSKYYWYFRSAEDGGYRSSDTGRAFENLVYWHLRYLVFSVHVGTLYGKEVDFVCEKAGQRVYVQVTESMLEESTKTRELAPLQSIRDGFPKKYYCSSRQLSS